MTLALVCDEWLMIRIYANAGRRAKPLVRQVHARVIADRYAGHDDSFHGPNPALDRGALAAKAGGATAMTPFGSLAGLSCDLSRIMPEWCCGQPGTQPASRVDARFNAARRAKSLGSKQQNHVLSGTPESRSRQRPLTPFTLQKAQ
jgi:hypothetical protein